MPFNVRGRTWGLVVALVVGGCAGNGASAPGSKPASSTVAWTLDKAAAVAAAIDVRANGCGPRIGFGSGTVINGGDIVTAAHVVAGSTSVEVIDGNGARAPAKVVLFDPDLDLAVLRPADALGTPLTIRSM